MRCCVYLDLRNASWCWWDACQLEFAELVIVLCHGSLSLEHLNEYGGLVVLVCGECLTLLCWDNSVSERERKKRRGEREKECDMKKMCWCCCVCDLCVTKY